MSWLNEISLTCREATLLIVKKQERSISGRERFQMYLHLIVCAVCRLFYKQTTLLDKHIHMVANHDEMLPEVKMDEKKKLELQKKLSASIDS